MRAAGIALALFVLACTPSAARTLEVGPQRELKNPSDAARIAADGDHIAIDPGEYFDCAIWRANSLVIAAAGPGEVVLTDRACAGKASFVIGGRDITLRGLTFTRIRVPDGNGAGIRAEGSNLTIEQCRFVNNQSAILAADRPAGFLVIRDSEFSDNGACSASRCIGTLAIGRLARLRVERSRFGDPRGSRPGEGEPAAGPQIASAADSTELVDNRIEDGTGASSALVAFRAEGGHLLMSGNLLEKGPHTEDARAAVFATGNASGLVLRRNTLVNHAGRPGVLLLNWTGASPELDANIIDAGDTATSSSGVWRHRLRQVVVTTKDAARHLAGSVLRQLRALL